MRPRLLILARYLCGWFPVDATVSNRLTSLDWVIDPRCQKPTFRQRAPGVASTRSSMREVASHLQKKILELLRSELQPCKTCSVTEVALEDLDHTTRTPSADTTKIDKYSAKPIFLHFLFFFFLLNLLIKCVESFAKNSKRFEQIWTPKNCPGNRLALRTGAVEVIVGELHLQPFQKINGIVLCTEEIGSPFARWMRPLGRGSKWRCMCEVLLGTLRKTSLTSKTVASNFTYLYGTLHLMMGKCICWNKKLKSNSYIVM